MLLFEEHVTVLLVVHGIFALATVALSTHLALWLRPIARGQYANYLAVRRFALLSLAAFAGTMLLGLALYPTYKVRVRAEYLENPSAITRGVETQAKARASAERHNRESLRFRQGEAAAVEPLAPINRDELGDRADRRIDRGARIARWFDIKEHWAAIGLMLSAAIALILLRWKPSTDSQAIGKPLLGLAVACALSAWGAAIIGLVTAATRSVAAL